MREVTWIICVCRPGVTNRMVGDNDSTDEYTIVSPMRTRLDPLYSGAPAHPLSGGGEYSGNSDIPSELV